MTLTVSRRLPRLQSLRLCLNEYNEDPLFPRERESLRLFLDAHGERILKFHQDGLGESMSAILSLCPNLTEIITEKPQASNVRRCGEICTVQRP